MITLSEHETIRASWAESCSGPGWSNRLIWVLIYEVTTGRHRVEALQPEEQSREIRTLFLPAAALSEELTGWVKACVKTAKPSAAGRGTRT